MCTDIVCNQELVASSVLTVTSTCIMWCVYHFVCFVLLLFYAVLLFFGYYIIFIFLMVEC